MRNRLLPLLLIMIVHAAAAAADTPARDAAVSAEQLGAYHALIISDINDETPPKNSSARAEINELDSLLRESYGFQTRLLFDTAKAAILKAVDDAGKRLHETDSLLIYYSGPTDCGASSDSAYRRALEAVRDIPDEELLEEEITSRLKKIPSRHILMATDGCYSGGRRMTEAGDRNAEHAEEEHLKKMGSMRSRTVLSGGENRPGGSGRNPAFAQAFIKALSRTGRTVFTAEEIFVRRTDDPGKVASYGYVSGAGHEGGDFVFRASAPAPRPVKPPQTAPVDSGNAASPGNARPPEREAETKSSATSSDKTAKSALATETKPYTPELDRTGWMKKQYEMKKAFDQLYDYERNRLPASLKAAAWERFVGTFVLDNPYSSEDDSMREKAKEKISKWQREKINEEGLLAKAKIRASEKRQAAEETHKESTTGMEFVHVKGGCYLMGDADANAPDSGRPVHEVCVNDFYIGRYEVTQGQWKSVMGSNPAHFSGCGDNCPVENIGWMEAQDFLMKLNARSDGRGFYRLPTEAEWEYAARSGGRKEKYSGGDIPEKFAWHYDNSGRVTHPVGRKLPNGLGIYDMSGNVWEWCRDWYGEKYYAESPADNPQGSEDGTLRVLRGGSGFNQIDHASTSFRSKENIHMRYLGNGLRLVMTHKPSGP